jgi:DNA repair photolyase
VWSLDFAHGNPFCPGELQGPGLFDDAVPPLDGMADELAKELAFRSDHPKTVLIGPDADPFSSIPDIQNEIARIIEVLARQEIVAWIMTRGTPLPPVMETLIRNQHRVRLTVSLTTVDRELQSVIEPDAASPEQRVALIAELLRLNIPVEVSLDPLLPSLTDTRDRLWGLLERLAAVGVTQVTAGYLVLRPGVRDRLRDALEPHGWAASVLGAFDDGPVLRDGPNPPAQYLSKAKRQRGYAALMALGSEFDISTRLSSLANPDFRPPRAPEPSGLSGLRQRLRPLAGSVRAASA